MKAKLYLLAILFLGFVSCSDNSDESSNGSLGSVNTVSAEVLDALSVKVVGNMTSTGGSFVRGRGIVIDTSQNPEINTGIRLYDQGQELGNYSFIFTGLEANTTYYARAYAENDAGVQYGNIINFTTGSPVTTNDIANITTTTAKLKGFISQPSSSSQSAGFVYSTTQNPTTNSSPMIEYTIVGSDNYSADIQGLLTNTTYYVRSYVRIASNNFIYGEQKQFKTAGYPGQGGGIVVYDKGDNTDGWRYLEVHPTDLDYNSSSSYGSNWGPATFISGLSNQLGSGLSNSEIIASQVTQANCAAKLCMNLVRGGRSDWFLGSSDEMLLAAKSLKPMGTILDNAWTSTQTNAQYANAIFYQSGPETFSIFVNQPKSHTIRVYAMRRY